MTEKSGGAENSFFIVESCSCSRINGRTDMLAQYCAFEEICLATLDEI